MEAKISAGGISAPVTLILVHAKSKGAFIPGDLFAYEREAEAATKTLKEAGARRIYLAGNGEAIFEPLIVGSVERQSGEGHGAGPGCRTHRGGRKPVFGFRNRRKN